MHIRKNVVYLLILLFLTSCAPLPGNKLYPGLTEPTPLEEVDLTIVVGFEEASQFCNKKMSEHGYEWMVVFN